MLLVKMAADADEAPETPPVPGLPRGLALAWGVAQPARRGPKPEMTIHRIVEAAIDIADEGGLGKVSMAAVAARLGFSPMALYRYVSSKGDLTLLMHEKAFGPVPPGDPVGPGEDWRTRLLAWAHAERDALGRHPWLLDVPLPATTFAPNMLRWIDSGLAALAPTGLPEGEKLVALLLVSGQVHWYAGLLRAAPAAASSMAVADPAILSTLVAGENLLSLNAAIKADAFQNGPDWLEYSLARVFDGIQSRVDSVATSG